MKTLAIVVLPVALLAACSWISPAPEKAPPAADVARTAPPEGEEGPGTEVFDEATRRAALAKRFPGAERLELVRLLQWTGERAGTCWTEASPPWEMVIDARYTVGRAGETTASGIEALKEQGWIGLYRTPNGSGFERRAVFRSADLTVSTEYRCRCMVGTAGAVEERKLPVRLRFRWKGKGTMPEVSASIDLEGRRKGLPVAFAPGSLLTYEFAVRDSFPGGRAGRCGGTLELSLLSTPPMQ